MYSCAVFDPSLALFDSSDDHQQHAFPHECFERKLGKHGLAQVATPTRIT
jgi:hypothetical protein